MAPVAASSGVIVDSLFLTSPTRSRSRAFGSAPLSSSRAASAWLATAVASVNVIDRLSRLSGKPSTAGNSHTAQNTTQAAAGSATVFIGTIDRAAVRAGTD